MSKIGKNMVWLLASQASTWIVSIVMLVAVPRIVTDSQFGKAEFAFTFVSFFTLIAQLGTNTFIVKTTARDQSLMVPFVVNSLVMKFVVVIVLSGAAIGLSTVISDESQVVVLVAICCLSMFATVMNDTLVAGLHGRQEMRGPAVWAAIQGYVSAGASLIVLITTDDLAWYMLALVSAGFVPMIANFFRLWPELRGHRGIDFRMWRRIARGGAPFLIWAAIQLVYGKIDIPLLQAFSGSNEVGWYSLAYSWVSMPVFVTAIVATALFPSLSEHGAALTEGFRRLGNQSLRMVMFIALPAAAGIALVADDVFSTLHYSAEYRHSIPVMRVLALHIPVVAMDIMLGLMLMAADRQRQWIYVGLAAATLNPILNLAAIPITNHVFQNGAIGAAVVTVLTEMVMMVGAIRLRPKGILDRSTVGYVWRCIAAALAMAPPVLLLDDAWFAVRVAVGVAAYLLASLLLRTFSFRTWRQDFIPVHHREAGTDDDAAVFAPTDGASPDEHTTLDDASEDELVGASVGHGAVRDDLHNDVHWTPPSFATHLPKSTVSDWAPPSSPRVRRLLFIRATAPSGAPAPRSRMTVHRDERLRAAGSVHRPRRGRG